MALYRKGDRVWVAGEVVADQRAGEPSAEVRLSGMLGSQARVFNTAELSLRWAHFEVGDTVTWNRDAENIGIVRATLGAAQNMRLWVEDPNGMVTLMATSCEYIPPSNNLLVAAARSLVDPELIDAIPPGWMRWDGKAPPELYGSWITVRVMFKDRTEQPLTQDFDWMADRGDNPIIAYFDEIPF